VAALEQGEVVNGVGCLHWREPSPDDQGSVPQEDIRLEYAGPEGQYEAPGLTQQTKGANMKFRILFGAAMTRARFRLSSMYCTRG
jgi:hypothetical protein